MRWCRNHTTKKRKNLETPAHSHMHTWSRILLSMSMGQKINHRTNQVLSSFFRGLQFRHSSKLDWYNWGHSWLKLIKLVKSQLAQTQKFPICSHCVVFTAGPHPIVGTQLHCTASQHAVAYVKGDMLELRVLFYKYNPHRGSLRTPLG